jgi:UDP-N-acetylglucosamine 4-epimerase
MKLLITGAAVCIGSNLCEYFINQDIEVVCLDNFAIENLRSKKFTLVGLFFKIIFFLVS